MTVRNMLIPALIAKSATELSAVIERVGSYFELLQLDIMDGRFVDNHSLDFPFDLPPGRQYEAHLMVDNPEEWIDKNWKKVHTVLAHIETCKNPQSIIEFLKDKRKVGFAVNPETPVEKIYEYLDRIDQVQIMTVHPGSYGSEFLPEALEKVRKLRKKRPDLNIEVDGGIGPDTIKQAQEAGTNMFVSGSYIVKSDDIQGAINTLENILRGEDDKDQ
jgi:ribulose-phosphate 3-epimerase